MALKGIKEKNFNSSLMLQYTPDRKIHWSSLRSITINRYGADAGVPADDGRPYDWINPMINLSDSRDYLHNEKKRILSEI